MFDIVKAVILGIVQGLTEFIPVSSSGHLVLVPWLMGWPPSSLLFDAILHWGTLCAILIIFGQEFLQMGRALLRSPFQASGADSSGRLAWFVILGSIPVAVTGLMLQRYFDQLFTAEMAPLVAGCSLLLTTLLLVGSEQLTKRFVQQRMLDKMQWKDSLNIGLAQVVALLPGVSRSGTTIAAGLITGLRRDEAARFSFLLGAPVFFGAGLLKLSSALMTDAEAVAAQAPMLFTGFIVSAVTGFVAIRFLLTYLRKNNLNLFAVYCAIIGTFTILLYLFG